MDLSLSLSPFGILEASLGCTSGSEGQDTSLQLTEARWVLLGILLSLFKRPGFLERGSRPRWDVVYVRMCACVCVFVCVCIGEEGVTAKEGGAWKCIFWSWGDQDFMDSQKGPPPPRL